MAGYYPSGMPHYPGADEVPVGAENQVGQAQIRMSYFSTADPPLKVSRFYLERWRARRFFVRETLTHLGGMVSAYDVRYGRVYQILIHEQQGGAAVFPSVTTTPLAAGMNGGKVRLPLKLMPGSRILSQVESGEGDVRATINVSISSEALKDTVAYYKMVLSHAGYKQEIPREPPVANGQRMLLFKNSQREVTINLTELGKKKVRVHIAVIGSGL